MSGILQTSGDGGGFEHCVHCGALAAGPCARCRSPVCGDCCVLTEHSAQMWAICIACNRRGGRSLRHGWFTVALWLLTPIVVLVVLLAILVWLFGDAETGASSLENYRPQILLSGSSMPSKASRVSMIS